MVCRDFICDRSSWIAVRPIFDNEAISNGVVDLNSEAVVEKSIKQGCLA